jgi:SMI1/KNR4 family protein SUKH-1
MADLPLDLFKRIADRANDPMRRTYMAGARANAQPLDFGALIGDLKEHGAPGAQSLLGAFGKLQGLMGGSGGALMMGPGGLMSMAGGEPAGPQPLGPVPDQTALDDAAKRIGGPLPDEVRQLYAIGDGGFGPGEGLFPLAELVARYEEVTAEDFCPEGQEWPKSLLPLFSEDPVLVCIDMDGGGIVAWDPEEIEDEDSDEDWRRSFKREQSSLAALMSEWLESSTFGEEHR